MADAERRLGVGVIGCGGIGGKAHLPNYAKNPRVRLVAVADIDPQRARTSAEEWNIPAYYDDYRDLIANPDVEAVSVATWPAAHAGPVIAAAAAGKHILCEKPIAISLTEADAMVAAADRAGVKFAMGYQHRFGAVLPAVKRLLDEGVVGRPMTINTVGAGPSAHGAAWFLRKASAGGGVLMDWGIYTAYTLNWLMGPVARIYASSAIFRDQVMVRGEPVTGIDVEDTLAATLTFQNGVIGTWATAWAVAGRHGSTVIDGDRGSIMLRNGEDGIGVFTTTVDEPDYLRGWRRLPVVELPLAETHYRKLAHLVDAVLDDTPLVLTGADGRDALELVLAAYRSAETGQAVDLPMARAAPASVAAIPVA